MRAALLAADGPLSACTRYRALQHRRRLEARLGRVDAVLHVDHEPRSPALRDRAAFFGRSAGGYGRELAHLPRTVKRYDAVLVQRGLYSLGPGTIARGIERFDGRVVFDLDDAVFIGSPGLEGRSLLARRLYGPQQTLRLLRRADAVVVSTEALAELLPEWANADAILPTVPDPSRYEVVTHQDNSPVAVGWVGTIRNLPFLDPLQPALARLRRDGIAELEVVSAAPWRGPATFRPWRLEEEASVFSRYAIGIMPLPDTPYTRAKAGFKLLQYMAAGVPVVADPVGVNRRLVEESGGGLLADGSEEWEEAIRTLAAGTALRAELGARGRAFVEAYADLDGQADVLAALLRGSS